MEERRRDMHQDQGKKREKEVVRIPEQRMQAVAVPTKYYIRQY
jgi:hypothetical protein